MTHLLVKLTGLNQRGYLLLLVMYFNKASAGLAWPARMQAAIQAVLMKGKIGKKEFDKTVLSVVWPESSNFPDQRGALLGYIGRTEGY